MSSSLSEMIEEKIGDLNDFNKFQEKKRRKTYEFYFIKIRK